MWYFEKELTCGAAHNIDTTQAPNNNILIKFAALPLDKGNTMA